MTNLPHHFHFTQEGREYLDSLGKINTFDGRIDSHPLHKAIYDLCLEIEKLPASEQATAVVSMAAALPEPVAAMLYEAKHALTLCEHYFMTRGTVADISSQSLASQTYADVQTALMNL